MITSHFLSMKPVAGRHLLVVIVQYSTEISYASTNTPPTQLLRSVGLLDWQLQMSVSVEGFNSSCRPVKTKL